MEKLFTQASPITLSLAMSVAMATRWSVKVQDVAVRTKSGLAVYLFAKKSTAAILEHSTTVGWKTLKQGLDWVPASFSVVMVTCYCQEILPLCVKLMADGDMLFPCV